MRQKTNRRTTLSIAGLRCCFVLSPARAAKIKKRYSRFIGTGAPHAVLQVRPFVRRTRPLTPCLFTRGKTLVLQRFDFICSLDMGSMQGTLDIADSRYSFDSFLRILYSSLLIRNHGCLMHAAGIIRGNAGIVFPGVSGSGKTTIARACKSYGVISDEIVAIRRQGKSFAVHSTPFWGEMKSAGQNKTAPLKIIYFLSKSVTLWVSKMERTAIMVRLARCLFLFEKEPLATARAMTLLSSLAARVPVKILGFPRNRTIPWPMLMHQ